MDRCRFHTQAVDRNGRLALSRMEVPDGYTVNVHENTGNTLHFVLPLNPNGELSDLELEAVAGGKGELLEKVYNTLFDRRTPIGDLLHKLART